MLRKAEIFSFATAAVLSVTLASEAKAECRVGDFKAESAGNLSDIQQLAYMSLMSEEQYNSAKTSGGLSGRYKLIGGSANYSQFRETVTKQLEALQLNHFQSYQKSWAESALNDYGLAAYRACLRQQGGFKITVSELGPQLNQLAIDWVPGIFGTMTGAPQIISSNNVANMNEIASLFGSQPWGIRERRFEIPLRRENPNAAADLTIRTPFTSETVYVPPAEVPVECRVLGESVSWSNASSVIQERPPAAALLGCPIRVDVDGRAYSRSTGQIWAEVFIETATEGRRQMCASPQYTQSINMGVTYQCSFRLPYDTTKLIIGAGNRNADARGVRATVSY